MSIKNIVRIGNPILATEAKFVNKFDTAWIKGLIQDLYDTMEYNGAIGLTAPQIEVDARVMVIGPNSKRPNIPKLAIINPAYEIINHDLVGNWESCFSIPGMIGYVKRYNTIRYNGVTYDNRPITGVIEGWYSIVFQHEVDHLNGITLLNKISDYSKFGFKEEVKKYLMDNT